MESILAKEAKERMDANKDIIILDVRRPKEYAVRRIPGSILLPVREIEDRAEDVLPDLDAEILVYCESGPRSIKAALILEDMGYTNVSSMGGLERWPFEIDNQPIDVDTL